MSRIDIVILGLPERLIDRTAHLASTLDAKVELRDRLNRGLVHVVYNMPEDLVMVACLYDRIHQFMRADTSIRIAAHDALNNVVYTNDPECIIPRCNKEPCRTICGGDQWSTVQYQSTRPWDTSGPIPNRKWKGDCDDIELQVAGMGAGKALFILPNTQSQGHVMHLNEPYSRNAADYCIPAGMKEWRGPRECFFFDNGNMVKGRINNTSKREQFVCTW